MAFSQCLNFTRPSDFQNFLRHFTIISNPPTITFCASPSLKKYPILKMSYYLVLTHRRAVGRFENPGVPVVMWGHNVPPPHGWDRVNSKAILVKSKLFWTKPYVLAMWTSVVKSCFWSGLKQIGPVQTNLNLSKTIWTYRKKKFEPTDKVIYTKYSKQFHWNSFFYVSGQNRLFWAALKLL